jgi:hypothetical protein
MRARELRVGFELRDEAIVRQSIVESKPSEKRDKKEHRDNRDIVGRGDDDPELVPVTEHC